MQFLYLIVVRCVGFLLPVIAVFVKKGKFKEFVDGRRLQSRRLDLPKRTRRYWFHCASLGEFEQARPVMEKLKSEDPDCGIIISFFSPSGYRQKHNEALADAVLYLPLDTPSNARRFIEMIKPDVAVFVKYEIWYFHLKELAKRNIPVYLVSAVFRPGQYLFSFWGKWLYNLLPGYKTIFLQDEGSFELLEKKGLRNIKLSGDTRYDRVRQNALSVKENTIIRDFKANKPLLLLGSSWPAEEDILLHYLDSGNANDLNIIIAPHDISDAHVNEICNKFSKYHPALYTGYPSDKQTSLMVLNTIGHLASAYFYADVAFIGGAFGKGLHNILEPLTFGVPVIFGPNYAKYPEAYKAMESQVAISISEYDGFSSAMHVFLRSEEQTVIRIKCIDFINWNSGATDLVCREMLGN